jgi:hypothetical protein
MSEMNKNYTLIRDIVQAHIRDINGAVESKGWLAEIVMDSLDFHPNRAQISLGKRLAIVFRKVAQLTYPTPRVVAGLGVTKDELSDIAEPEWEVTSDTQIYTRLERKSLVELAGGWFENFRARRKRNRNLKIDSVFLDTVVEDARRNVPLQDEMYTFNVDLCLENDNVYKMMELKSTADEDNTGAETTVTHRIMIPRILIPNSQTFLGIISNNKGYKRNGEWKGQIGSWVPKDRVLIEQNLWNAIAPAGVSFDDFKQIVKQRFLEVRENEDKRVICGSSDQNKRTIRRANGRRPRRRLQAFYK